MVLAAKLEDATEKNPVTPGTLLPAREMLGDLLLEMNRPKDALLQYVLSLKNSPNRLNTLYGAGKSAELLGDLEKAKFYFSALLKNNKSSKTNNERLAHALNLVNNKM
jgi:tetratricopeptide (TPR) repeat protein